MKRTATFPLFAGILMALLCSNAAGQVSVPDTSAATLTASDTTAVQATDMADTAVVDSARLAQMAIQAELSREVAAFVTHQPRFSTVDLDARGTFQFGARRSRAKTSLLEQSQGHRHASPMASNQWSL